MNECFILSVYVLFPKWLDMCFWFFFPQEQNSWLLCSLGLPKPARPPQISQTGLLGKIRGNTISEVTFAYGKLLCSSSLSLHRKIQCLYRLVYLVVGLAITTEGAACMPDWMLERPGLFVPMQNEFANVRVQVST